MPYTEHYARIKVYWTHYCLTSVEHAVECMDVLYRVEWTQFFVTQSCRTSNCFVVPLLCSDLHVLYSVHLRMAHVGRNM
jgi:hypothetical protein